MWWDDPDIWAPGYSQAELDDVQARYCFRFPVDLADLLRERRLVPGWDWRGSEEALRWAFAQPLEGLVFDVGHTSLWLPEWGERPDRPEERAEILRAAVAQAPTLIPIFSHRYMPDWPHEAGNPVFSVSQSDIIVYGHDLQAYLRHEFCQEEARPCRPIRAIPFWSRFLD
jgi:hypothetical protein